MEFFDKKTVYDENIHFYLNLQKKLNDHIICMLDHHLPGQV